MKSPLLLIAALSVTLAACASSKGVTEPAVYSIGEATDSIPIAYGETVAAGNVLVSFHDVLQDSRCPLRAECVWAGDATVSVGAALACTRSTPRCLVPEALLTLHTNLEPRAGEYAGMEIRLLNLEPVPEVPGGIRKQRYVAWFRIRAISN